MNIYGTVAQFPYSEIHSTNTKTTVYGFRVDVVNNGESELRANGIKILPQGVYTFSYPSGYVISDDLSIEFPNDPENLEGLNECLILVYKPSKEIISL